jgi:xanthine dehydrogenase accessory factor
MRDVLTVLEGLLSAEGSVALATVVGTSGSAPRPPGASMLVGPDSQVVGSVSGGCVESELYELCRDVLHGHGAMLQRYGISDDEAFAVGLTCGGVLDVFVERIDGHSLAQLGRLAKSVRDGEPVACATVVAGRAGLLGGRLTVWPHGTEGSTGSRQLDVAVAEDARGLLAAGRSSTLCYGTDGRRHGLGITVFVESFAPAPRLIVFGAIDFAAALARIGAFLGYQVTICDARAVFATAGRFPEAHDVVVDWPHRYVQAEADAGRIDARTALCVLTHDPKFDVPLLQSALRLPEVGVMGSRHTHADRLSRLRQIGLTEAELGRMASPIGLDLGARTPEETAVSIAAEMIATDRGRPGTPLRGGSGPIHGVREETRERWTV